MIRATYSEICQLLVDGIDFDRYLYGRGYTPDERRRFTRVSRVEVAVFNHYMQTGKSNLAAFDESTLQLFRSKKDSIDSVRRVVNALSSTGWTPAVHVGNTRKHHAGEGYIRSVKSQNRKV